MFTTCKPGIPEKVACMRYWTRLLVSSLDCYSNLFLMVFVKLKSNKTNTEAVMLSILDQIVKVNTFKQMFQLVLMIWERRVGVCQGGANHSIIHKRTEKVSCELFGNLNQTSVEGVGRLSRRCSKSCQSSHPCALALCSAHTLQGTATTSLTICTLH